MEVKGTAIVVLPEYVRRKHGEAAYLKWLGSLPEGSRRLFQSPVRLSDWFPGDMAYLEPSAAVCRLFFPDETTGARELGRYSADYALHGVYRMFLRLHSVKFFLGRASHMLATYLRPCSSRVETVEDGRAVIRVTELPGSHRLLEERVAGWIQRALEIHGCREVKVGIPRSLAAGDPFTEYDITWTS